MTESGSCWRTPVGSTRRWPCKWIAEEWGAEVIALAVDVGQSATTTGRRSARGRSAAGAVEAIVVDARDEFARDYCLPALKANALYEGKYPLVSALSRPVIVKHLVAAARESRRRRGRPRLHGQGQRPGALRGVDAGARPDLEVLAPVRVWGFTREDSIDYAAKHDIPIKVTQGGARTRSTRTSGAGPSSAARSRTRGSRRRSRTP